LRRLERHRGFLPALRAGRSGLGPIGHRPGSGRSEYGNSLRLTHLATFRFVFELLVVEKQLFARGENKIGTAVDTFQYLVLEVHPSPHSPVAIDGRKAVLSARAICAQSRYAPPLRFTLGFGPLRVTQALRKEEKRCRSNDCRHLFFTKRRGKRMGRRLGAATHVLSILFFACFFPAAFAGERFLDALFFAGLQVKGVALDLLDDVFLLHLALESPQCILEGFALLKSDLSQTNYTPKLVPFGLDSYCKVPKASQGGTSKISHRHSNARITGSSPRCSPPIPD